MTVPEINLARCVQRRYRLRPPVDVFALAEKHSIVEIFPFPVDLDGVCFNLKAASKRATILLNENRPPRRRRFTLAHEIGHVLIPWHVGTIVDDIDAPLDTTDLSYWELEGEANRFAAELLMPTAWIENLLEANDDPSETLEIIADGADVSVDAAIIKMIGLMPPGYVYAFLDADGAVRSSGRSDGTRVARPSRGTFLDPRSVFPKSDQRWSRALRGASCCWWHFPGKIKLPMSDDSRTWQEILNDILSDLGITGDESLKIKQSLNGIIGFINGDIHRRLSGADESNFKEKLFAACIQRFNSQENDNMLLNDIISHTNFEIYLSKRVEDLVSR